MIYQIYMSSIKTLSQIIWSFSFGLKLAKIRVFVQKTKDHTLVLEADISLHKVADTIL